MADSFRSEVNVSLYEWSIESLGLFDLKRIITIRSIGVSNYRESYREQTTRAVTVADFYHHGGNGPTTASGAVL